MALKNDFLIKGIDFCVARKNVYTAYLELVKQDNEKKKQAKIIKNRAKLDRTEAPLRLSLLSEDEMRAQIVDAPLAKYAKQLRMKYRVVREDVARKKAKALKANENADVTALDELLANTQKQHEDLVAARKAELDAFFDTEWAKREVNAEEITAELEKLAEANEKAQEDYIVKVEEAFAKRNEDYSKLTDARVKLWQKIEDLLKVQYDKQQASRQKKLEERAREDREPDARDKMVASIEKSLADVNEKQAKAKAKIEIGFWRRVAKFLGRIRALVKGASWATIEPLPEDIILRARDLSMHFGGLKAVEALDFDVKKGEIFGLIGPNGAGKTTVFNCITQFYKPTRGDLHFVTKEGKTISLTDYKVHDVILKGIARTFQNVEVVKEVTVLENMLIAGTRQYSSGLFTQMFHLPLLKKEERIVRAKADKVLNYMGLSLYRDRLAWGLPYGVLKRIEIARVLMCNPQLIILDEPAAGLNDTETVELAALIRKIRDDFDCTVLLVEHDMGLVMDVCDHICAISFGRKLAYGTPEEVQASKEVQEAYLGTGGND